MCPVVGEITKWREVAVEEVAQVRVLNRSPQLDGDDAMGRSSHEATDFASGAARRAVNEAGITGWLQERNRGHLGRSPTSDDADEATADPSTELVLRIAGRH